MILVILGICILISVIGLIVNNKANALELEGVNIASIAVTILAGLGIGISLIVTIMLGVEVSRISTIGSRIKMYQEENEKIEQQVANVVTQYQQYETKIFTTVAPEDSMTLISLYPELKSDKLVQNQIDVYVDNSKKIKSLKERQIDGKVVKWWLYFGGK